MKRNIMVKKGDTASFHNQVDFCVGTGRMGLALQKEYMEQLKLVQEYIGFKHIRGHGLFTDDMAIYQEREENGWLSGTGADSLSGAWLHAGEDGKRYPDHFLLEGKYHTAQGL